MGQKIHPIGFRLGISAEWRSNWFAGKPEGYRELVQEDYTVREIIADEYESEGAISRVDIDRGGGEISINVFTSRPGIIIGRNGQRIDRLRHVIERATGRRVRISANEIKVPELDAKLVGQSLAEQLERRIPYRRAVRMSMQRTMDSGAEGIKVVVSGRSGRSRDRSCRQADGRSSAFAHASRQDRLCGVGSTHHLWCDRHQSLDLYRRHACGRPNATERKFRRGFADRARTC